MKKIVFLINLLIVAFLLTTSFSSTKESKSWEPVFMKRTELEQSVTFISGQRTLKNPGKIYCKDNYIYVNELYKGVHVINNSNPENPVREGFITAPGCVDMAIKENIIYVDNAVDLVAFDLESKQVTERIKNVLPEVPSPSGGHYYLDEKNRPEGFILVGWEEVVK